MEKEKARRQNPPFHVRRNNKERCPRKSQLPVWHTFLIRGQVQGNLCAYPVRVIDDCPAGAIKTGQMLKLRAPSSQSQPPCDQQSNKKNYENNENVPLLRFCFGRSGSVKELPGRIVKTLKLTLAQRQQWTAGLRFQSAMICKFLNGRCFVLVAPKLGRNCSIFSSTSSSFATSLPMQRMRRNFTFGRCSRSRTAESRSAIRQLLLASSLTTQGGSLNAPKKKCIVAINKSQRKEKRNNDRSLVVLRLNGKSGSFVFRKPTKRTQPPAHRELLLIVIIRRKHFPFCSQ